MYSVCVCTRVDAADVRIVLESELVLFPVCQVVKRLPKTRSGKILRRILRKVAMGQVDSLGDVSTLDDPFVVTEIVEAHQRYRSPAARK